MKHRSTEDIVADILSVVANEPKKTHIMYGANLSYTLLRKYLDQLLGTRLVCYQDDAGTYRLTCKGSAYLQAYNEYKALQDTLADHESVYTQTKTRLSAMLARSSNVRGGRDA